MYITPQCSNAHILVPISFRDSTPLSRYPRQKQVAKMGSEVAELKKLVENLQKEVTRVAVKVL